MNEVTDHQKEVQALRDEISRLNGVVKNYVGIAAHFGSINSALRARLRRYEPVEDPKDK